MRLPYGSASMWNRVRHCPASLVLPTTLDISSSDAAARGTAIHAYLERVSNEDSEAMARVAEEYRPYCETLDLDDLPLGAGFVAEAAFALDLSTGEARVMGHGLDRGYQKTLKPVEIPGTADVVQVGPDHVYVGDYKTGRSVHVARDSWQMKMLGLMAARAYGKSSAVVEIIQLMEDGSVYKNQAEWDEWDLQEIFARVFHVAGLVRGLRDRGDLTASDVVEGDHCQWCPAFSSCPAKIALLNHLVTTDEKAIKSGVHSRLTMANAHEAYTMWRRMKKIVDEVGAALHAYAKRAPIDLENGKVYGPVETVRESLDPQTTVDVVKKQLGEQYAMSAVKFSVTKTSVTNAARAAWKDKPEDDRPTLKAITNDLMGEIADRGGVKGTVSSMIKEHK